MKLQKQITSVADIHTWEKCQAYSDILGFIQSVNRAVVGKKLTDSITCSEDIIKVCTLLEALNSHIDQVPPDEQPQRFGNKAFRVYYAWLETDCGRLITEHLQPAAVSSRGAEEESSTTTAPAGLTPEVVGECAAYLTESMGNSTRIDYGTGHELAFVAFLVCLFKTGVLQPEVREFAAVGLRVLPVYLDLVRRLQGTYRMEPAGSQGVWSLDDFQFVPFIWGSAQLLSQCTIEPTAIAQKDKAEALHKDYLLFGCLKYINQVKTGPFEEHSNTLYGISGVPLWDKVNTGLIKMYKAEVLAKFPVVQHFLFGSLLTFTPASPFRPPGAPGGPLASQTHRGPLTSCPAKPAV